MTGTRPFDPALFSETAIEPETAKLNAQMVELLTGQPEWWIVGAEAVRAARRRGEGPFPAPVMSSRARILTITGKDGHDIPLRVIAPAQPRGLYLHLHGGWVLGGADMQDPLLERIADSTGQAVIGVEYRLGPEHPYPAGPDDCEAAAHWLVKRRKRIRHRDPDDRRRVGGRTLDRGDHSAHARPARLHRFRGADIVYGAFDLSLTPSQRLFGDTRLVLRTIDMQQFYNAFLPTITDRRVHRQGGGVLSGVSRLLGRLGPPLRSGSPTLPPDLAGQSDPAFERASRRRQPRRPASGDDAGCRGFPPRNQLERLSPYAARARNDTLGHA
jgi:acetyl esterase